MKSEYGEVVLKKGTRILLFYYYSFITIMRMPPMEHQGLSTCVSRPVELTTLFVKFHIAFYLIILSKDFTSIESTRRRQSMHTEIKHIYFRLENF